VKTRVRFHPSRDEPSIHLTTMKVNKQLNDKERVAAALENPTLLDTVEQCLANAGARGHL
jgi:hypothetical protein